MGSGRGQNLREGGLNWLQQPDRREWTLSAGAWPWQMYEKPSTGCMGQGIRTYFGNTCTF